MSNKKESTTTTGKNIKGSSFLNAAAGSMAACM